MTQHQKIIDMCLEGNWHCQNEFRDRFIFSPHKRRNEIAGKKKEDDLPTGKYDFVKRKCEHGVSGQFDYKMYKVERFTSGMPSVRRINHPTGPEAVWTSKSDDAQKTLI